MVVILFCTWVVVVVFVLSLVVDFDCLLVENIGTPEWRFGFDFYYSFVHVLTVVWMISDG